MNPARWAKGNEGSLWYQTSSQVHNRYSEDVPCKNKAKSDLWVVKHARRSFWLLFLGYKRHWIVPSWENLLWLWLHQRRLPVLPVQPLLALTLTRAILQHASLLLVARLYLHLDAAGGVVVPQVTCRGLACRPWTAACFAKVACSWRNLRLVWGRPSAGDHAERDALPTTCRGKPNNNQFNDQTHKHVYATSIRVCAATIWDAGSHPHMCQAISLRQATSTRIDGAAYCLANTAIIDGRNQQCACFPGRFAQA